MGIPAIHRVPCLDSSSVGVCEGLPAFWPGAIVKVFGLREKAAAAFGLVVASFLFAVAGVSYKWFISIGFTFLSFFWITRLVKLLTVFGILRARGIGLPVVTDRRELIFLYLNGFFSVVAPIFFGLALLNTKISNAYFLSYTMPAWTLLFAVAFLGEKLSPKKLLAVMLTIAGIAFIAKPIGLASLDLGFIFGILAALGHTGDIITSRELKDYQPETVSLYSNFFQFVIFTLAFFAVAPSPFAAQPAALVYLAAVGVMLGIASSFYYYSLHYIEASKAGILSLAELIFALIFGLVFFQEAPAPLEWIGYCLIIGAAGIVILRKPTIPDFTWLINFKRKY